jgi:uncharacterized protein (DUF302 family)
MKVAAAAALSRIERRNDMKRWATLLAIAALLASSSVWAGNGLINVRSEFGVERTMNRLQKVVKVAGMKVFARIDHAKGAASVGKSLRPTQLLIFGSPKAGTPLMISDQRVGIDLPLKVLVWRDAKGVVWLSYTRPARILNRFGIHDREPVKNKMAAVLAKFAKAATQNP